MTHRIQHRLLPGESIDEFDKWAFGDNVKSSMTSIKYMNYWNEIHGKELTLHCNDLIEESIDKMIQLWRNHERS